jgi:hypothetical protein
MIDLFQKGELLEGETNYKKQLLNLENKPEN